MAERSKLLERVRAEQIAEIDKFLVSEKSATRMSDTELAREGRRLAGWFVEMRIKDSVFKLRVLLGKYFPFHPAEIFLKQDSLYLKFPHVEKTGKLCLTAGHASFSPARPVETVKFLLDEADQLLADSVAGKNRDDFILEFQSYWPGHLAKRAKPFWNALEHKEETRIVTYWPGSKFTLFAECAVKCREWVKNFGGGVVDKRMETFPTLFVWLTQPLYPEHYPTTGAALRRLGLASTPDLDQKLMEVTPQEYRELPILFGFSTSTGPVFGGVVIREPTVLSIGENQRRHWKADGFRTGKMSPETLVRRYFGGDAVQGANVFRADPAWIHQRGGSTGSSMFFGKRIGILGCGSLGAEIAFMLAKSGVGSLFVADNQNLSLDNIGRHLLSANYVGQNKAEALETFLKMELPALTVTSASRDIESVLSETPGVFDSLDLIVSTTGDWASDCALNVAARDWSCFPPTIFGWTEAYGVAGHALLVQPKGGCLSCGMSEHGEFQHRVVDWVSPEKTLLRATGCGDFYQAYSVTDVAPTKAMIAELALECLMAKVSHSVWRTWVGDSSRIANLGGSLSNLWSAKTLKGEYDKRFCHQQWDANPQCPLCN